VGYSLSASTREQVFFFAYGKTRAGKTTFLECVTKIIGDDYCATAPPDVFLARKTDEHPTALARLRGVRIVSTVEMSNKRLDEGLIKSLTGEEKIAARFMHRDYFEFRPQFKIWMTGNDRPSIHSTCDAIWRRPLLIPFDQQIAEAEKDLTLPPRLEAEAPNILAWAVAGAKAYTEMGLDPPEDVKAATRAYRDSEDILGPWISDRAALVPSARSTNRDLYASYKAWCEEEGCDPIHQRTFGARLAERGLRPFVSHGQRGWDGIALSCREVPSATRSAYREED